MEKIAIMAGFVISGENVNPDILTDRLGIEPTRSWRKGDKKEQHPNLVYLNGHDSYTSGLWEVNTGYQESLDINTEIKKIYNLFKNKTQQLCEIRDVYGLVYTTNVVIKLRSYNTPVINVEFWFIDFLHDIKAEFGIDLYVSEDITENQ